MDKQNQQVIITQYKWAGKWGPFRIKSHCDECDLTTTLLKKLVEDEFTGKPVVFEVKPWLDNWIYCLQRGAYHPPIIMVNGQKFFNFSHKHPLFDRERLITMVKNCLM